MIENLSDYLELRLEEWADFYGRCQNFGIGFPSETLEYKLWKTGTLIKSTGKRYELQNENAEEMERWICDLMKTRPKEGKAIRDRYLAHHSISIAKLARQSNISVKTLEQWIAAGKSFLRGCLYCSQTKNQKAA